MSISKWWFATWYDLLNVGVEWRLSRFREQTAGRTWGEVLEIGGGTGANLSFYPPKTRLTVIEPDVHMQRRLERKAAKIGRENFPILPPGRIGKFARPTHVIGIKIESDPLSSFHDFRSLW